MKFSALGTGAAHPAARQIRTSAPGHLPRLKTPLTSLFFCCFGWPGSNDKNRCQFFWHFSRTSAGPTGAEMEQDKDKA